VITRDRQLLALFDRRPLIQRQNHSESRQSASGAIDPKRPSQAWRRGAEKAVIVTLRRYGIVGIVDDGCSTSSIERWERNRSWASEQGHVRHAVIEATVFPGARANTERGRRSAVANTSTFDVELGGRHEYFDAVVEGSGFSLVRGN
jgi:hypothetical protein